MMDVCISLPLVGASHNFLALPPAPAPALAPAPTTRHLVPSLCYKGGGRKRWSGESLTTLRRVVLPFGLRNSDVWQFARSTRFAWNLGDVACHGLPFVRSATGYGGKGGRKASQGKDSGKSKGVTKGNNPQKGNVWSQGSDGKQQQGKLEKRPKQNVWSSDASPGNDASPLPGQRSSNSAKVVERSLAKNTGDREESSVVYSGGRFEREKVPNSGVKTVQSREEYPLSSSSTKSRNRLQQRGVSDDTMFLRFLSPNPPIEEEIWLQPEESISPPVWSTFCGNTSGVWRGVGAAFSPETGDFEPISLNKNNEFVYDVRVLSTVQIANASEDGRRLPSDQQSIHRRVLWSVDDISSAAGEGNRVVRDDDQTAEINSGATSFSAGADDSDDQLDMGYWEDDEDSADDETTLNWEEDVPQTEEEDHSKWDYVLSGPREYDQRWVDGEGLGEYELMDEIEEDSGSVQEDDMNWKSMWDEGEPLGSDWEEAGLVTDENERSLVDEESVLSSTSKLSTSNSSETPSNPEFNSGSIWTDIIEDDHMVLDAGLVYFDDGSYSRGPVDIVPDLSTSGRGDLDTYTCKVEQCLVAGGHTRLRIVHTVSVEKGEKVEILRLAIYEEEWMGPANMKSISDVGGHRLKLFTERPRMSPEEIAGSWKVFEVEGTSIHDSQSAASSTSPQGSFIFSCKETAIKRGFPVMPKLTYNDDDSIDLSAFSMLWLTGSVSACVSFSESGSLTFEAGWICENGSRLVLERVYGADGKLLHVKFKSELKSIVIGR